MSRTRTRRDPAHNRPRGPQRAFQDANDPTPGDFPELREHARAVAREWPDTTAALTLADNLDDRGFVALAARVRRAAAAASRLVALCKSIDPHSAFILWPWTAGTTDSLHSFPFEVEAPEAPASTTT